MASILLIEDEHTIREELVDALSFEGFAAIGAGDGETGIELAQKHLPDLVICDILLPGINGYEVLQHLRAKPETAHIPVMFLSALNNPQDIELGFSLGAKAYLTKPFRLAELMATISELVKP